MEMDQKQVQDIGHRLMGVLSSSHSLFSPSYLQLTTSQYLLLKIHKDYALFDDTFFLFISSESQCNVVSYDVLCVV